MREVVVASEPHAYWSHPCITSLDDGTWLVAFAASTPQPFPIFHPPNDPGFVTMLTRSHDEGVTWTAPAVAPDYDWYGVETPGVMQTRAGTVLLNQFRFRWYPTALARRRSDEGDDIFVLDPATFEWRPPRDESDWEAHPYPYARADGGAFVHRSHDRGITFTETTSIDLGEYRAAFSPRGAIELRTGELVLALGSHDHDPSGAACVVRSNDDGRTWSSPIEVARVPGKLFYESGAVECADGTVLIHSREETTGLVHQSRSRDGGISWESPRQLDLWGFPQHTIRLRDDRLLMVFGHRREPFGVQASISEDHGVHWSPPIAITVRPKDSLSGFNLGYPSVIEHRSGECFCVYYAEGDDGVTGIHATAFKIDEVVPA